MNEFNLETTKEGLSSIGSKLDTYLEELDSDLEECYYAEMNDQLEEIKELIQNLRYEIDDVEDHIDRLL